MIAEAHNSSFDLSNNANNFNLLRFLTANLVIYVHCHNFKHILPDPQHDYFSYFIYSLGNVGVHTFFVISGFLITKSYCTRNNLSNFIRARVLRIYPGLIFSLLLCCLIIGPIHHTISFYEYVHSPQLFSYFLNNLLLVKTNFDLPGVPDININFWTLPAEARLYLIIAGLGCSGILVKRRAYTLILLSGLAAFMICQKKYQLTADPFNYYQPSWFFFSGSLYYVYRKQIPLSHGICALLMTLLLASYLYFMAYLQPIYYMALPYITLWFAFKVKGLSRFNNAGDYSYGLYIYAYPIQKTIFKYWPDTPIIPFFYLSFICTLIIAIPSWHLLEKKALQYK